MLEVETSCGKIQGASESGVEVFRGIPYAAAPKGDLRFHPPQPVEPWTGVRDATSSGAAPPQTRMPVFGSWLNLAMQDLSEDCLSLNVFTPSADSGRRPVMLWIHGGAFMIGAGSLGVYDGGSLASRGDVVVVSINYRLGALGWTHLSTLYPEILGDASNAGLRDQVAALEWVRDNIESFGGDPNNVTVFGESAGGMSVGALLGSPQARGLFHRAICQSGAASHVLTASEAERVAKMFLEGLGGPPPSMRVLGRIHVRDVLRAQAHVLTRLGDQPKLMSFLPMQDDDVLPEHPLDAVARGAARDIPLLIGSTLHEWRLFQLGEQSLLGANERWLEDAFGRILSITLHDAPTPKRAVREYTKALEKGKRSTRPRAVLSAFQTARVFFEPATRLAEAQVAAGGTAYTYIFGWRHAALRRALGACHAIEIPFLFGHTSHPAARPITGLGGAAKRLSHSVQDAWTAFARGGDPNVDRLPKWAPYDAKDRKTMILDRECELKRKPLEGERRLISRWAGALEIPTPIDKARPRARRRTKQGDAVGN